MGESLCLQLQPSLHCRASHRGNRPVTGAAMLVLTHEAMHQRLRSGDEALVQCNAMKYLPWGDSNGLPDAGIGVAEDRDPSTCETPRQMGACLYFGAHSISRYRQQTLRVMKRRCV